MSATTHDQRPELLAQYEAGHAYDELLQNCGEPRAHYQSLYQHLLALPPEHPLATAARLDVAALAGETFLTLEQGHCLRDQTAAICRRLGLEPHHEVEASSIESLRQMVSLGVGCAIVPAFAGKGPFAAGAPITLRPLGGPPESRQLVLAWRRSHPHGEALRTLATAIGETVAAL